MKVSGTTGTPKTLDGILCIASYIWEGIYCIHFLYTLCDWPYGFSLMTNIKLPSK